MPSPELLFAGLNFALREISLFAACGFLVLGSSDLLVDLIWIGRMLRRNLRPSPSDTLSIGQAERPGLLAIFVPAWDESDVIGDMLRAALATFEGPEHRLYVGCYPNDPATIASVAAFGDPRLRIVVGPVPGPTTKADCLNRLWERMCDDEAREGRRFKAVVCDWPETVWSKPGGIWRDLAGLRGTGMAVFRGFDRVAACDEPSTQLMACGGALTR